MAKKPLSELKKKRKRIHGGYLGKEQYAKLLEEAEAPLTKRQLEQRLRKQKKEEEEGEGG